MIEASGPAWCGRFATSTRLEDLTQPFQGCVASFIVALRGGGAAVSVAATYRPEERAYLMHWSCMIAQGGQDPAAIPPLPGDDIDWTHGGDRAAAKAAAQAMVAGYSIQFPAALVSRHTQRRAIDMTIHWAGTIHVTDARGVSQDVTKQEDLWPIGASFGVKKLASDPPHWSDDGH